ncbi:unnamed protein product [Oppiella nova]|uniref:Fatty acid desaturase domain-containing protein n=1 Tax=Oppiella nova TaxID=334625 RepID=A0A7R9LFU9_9ACAR|nr:unnamed protein product [Oppiella nova]CAG2163155.1 unnamed protein product [Oppiella nova]
MTNNNNNNNEPNVANSGQQHQNSGDNKLSNEAKIAINGVEYIRSGGEMRVDIQDTHTTVDDEIPEEVWELESEPSEKPAIDCPQDITRISAQESDYNNDKTNKKSFTLCFGYKPSQFKWFNIFWLVLIHVVAVYAYGYAMWFPMNMFTIIWTVVLACGSGFGASAGSHRLWAHRAFKARWPLKLFLVITETMAVNGSCFSYARDHRNHHKFVDTNADPKNARRGFFFAHIGWWCVKKNPDVIKCGQKLTHKDLLEDTLVMFQHRFYYPMVVVWGVLFPVLVPYYGWGEDLLTAFLVCNVLRVVITLHHLFTVNSIAHIIGMSFCGKRPYDKGIGPTESKLTMYLSLGEGSHNYHHSFPMDYANCEKKWWEVFNPSTLFIDICEKLGLAYDLKKPSHQVIQGVIQRKGDPEYFERKLKRSLCTRICLGIVDWHMGLLVALWAVWLAVIFKFATFRPVFVITDDIYWP